MMPANTPVILRLRESLYKKDAKPGQSVDFDVAYDVVVNGEIVIQSGTAVKGSVRQVDRTAKGLVKVLIALGPAQTISGEIVHLASSSLSTNQSGSMADVVGMGAEAGPFLPVLVIASLFEKNSILLDKDAPRGAYSVAHATEDVALDPVKQKTAQEQYASDKKVTQAELCKLLESPDSQNWERIDSLARRSGLDDSTKADLLRRAGDLDAAIEVYQQFLSVKLPCSVVGWYFSSFQQGATLVEFKDRLEQPKRFSADLHLRLAELYQEKRDFVHAVSECRIAVQLDPEDDRARIGLLNTLQNSGDLDAAIAESDEAIRLWPDKFYFHYLLGSALVQKKDADAAIIELQWALKQTKNQLSPANCALGRAFEQKGDLEEAFRQYRIAIRAHLNDEGCRADYNRLKLQLKK